MYRTVRANYYHKARRSTNTAVHVRPFSGGQRLKAREFCTGRERHSPHGGIRSSTTSGKSPRNKSESPKTNILFMEGMVCPSTKLLHHSVPNIDVRIPRPTCQYFSNSQPSNRRKHRIPTSGEDRANTIAGCLYQTSRRGARTKAKLI